MSKAQDPITLEYLGTGRRKSSVARVRLKAGSGKITVNKRELTEYFPILTHQAEATSPLKSTDTLQKVDIRVTVCGGGPTGQAGALRLGIARALKNFEEEYEPALREGGHLTRDAREVERKKYGRRGARRSFQFSKR
ncbi:30S ribosomal protein S9 [Planctomycetales bacterium 10988]|nr:30S ribosomal protein S9 [Planctomycetales bacterium 10988]